ncbi:hypothetical protein [Amycolatopsis jejuensis]|uniref:hypothetical protein n=1 Tax=Amycolatopsis jejuensis TaxID=330084 RepID=UPI00068AE30F|nr:hypothetical protein [Amycolatopsis jejuensis]
MTRPEEPDDRIETHPDLIDPEWRKHAELDAWLGAKKELKKKRKQQRKAAPSYGYGAAAPSRWPGIAAIAGLIALLAAAVVVHQVQGTGVNEKSIGYRIVSSQPATPATPPPPHLL